jgi:GTP1/Obg family GTP-binding protein
VARKTSDSNGHARLEEAMATLIQNQAVFLSRASKTDRLHAKFERETAERFARIEAQMAEMIRVLNEHTRVLERLPDAIRDKIGFKPSSSGEAYFRNFN